MATLKEARKRAKLSQQQAANQLKVSRSYISKLETKAEPLSVEFALKLGKIYRINPNELI